MVKGQSRSIFSLAKNVSFMLFLYKVYTVYLVKTYSYIANAAI